MAPMLTAAAVISFPTPRHRSANCGVTQTFLTVYRRTVITMKSGYRSLWVWAGLEHSELVGNSNHHCAGQSQRSHKADGA